MAVLGLAAAACGDDEGSTPDQTATTTTATVAVESTEAPPTTRPPFVQASATVTGPIEGGAGIVQPQPSPGLPEGYTEAEYFIAGDATSFAPVGELSTDGNWTVAVADQAPFQTRVVVRAPDAADFSGVVVVEWMNVTSVEATPDWGYLSEIIAASGHAYVAVSAQALGVVGGDSLLEINVPLGPGGGLIELDGERYGDLVHPGDAYAFDLYSQVGEALANNRGGLLGDLEASTVIAMGESQSAFFLTSYINGVHSLAGVYDGFFVHSRGSAAASLDGNFGEDEQEAPAMQIRTDLDTPVFMVEAETDLTLLGFAAARQPDTATIRTWEIAGTAHADAHLIRAITGGPRTGAIGSALGCVGAINSGPHHEVAQAALTHLVAWVENGTPPPTGTPLELIETEDGVAIARDELGIALGGVRNPLVDVPVVVTSGDPWSEPSEDLEDFDICDLFGRTIPIELDGLIELHGSAEGYAAAFASSLRGAVADGFLLDLDAEQLLEEMQLNQALFE
ncbi:MAG: hypothetical protein ACI9MX_003351 [Candidatus Aldehydirespiratoraceae bacterium]|jgi:hypothetical protein